MIGNESAHVRAWLLEAELHELRNPPTEIAAHLDVCLQCQADRAGVLRGHADLDRGLDKLVQRKHRRWGWALVPLTAAAVVALLLTQREKPPIPPSPLLAQLMFPQTPVVTPPADKQAMILEKNDLTVVWLY